MSFINTQYLFPLRQTSFISLSGLARLQPGEEEPSLLIRTLNTPLQEFPISNSIKRRETFLRAAPAPTTQRFL